MHDLNTTPHRASAVSRSRTKPKFVTGWTDLFAVRLAYNGSDRKTRKPSIAPNCNPLLRDLPEGWLIEVELRRKGSDDAPIVCEARRNSHYFFLRRVRLPDGWPEPPNDKGYEARFRVIGYDDPTAPDKMHRLPSRPDHPLSASEPENPAATANVEHSDERTERN